MIELLKMTVNDNDKNDYRITIEKRNGEEQTEVVFNTATKGLNIDEGNSLGQFLKANEYQFRKLLHNKRPETYHIGFTLQFSIIDQKDIEKFNDKSNIVVTEDGRVYVIKESEEVLLQVYTDGSYDEKSRQGAYGYALVKGDEIIKEVYEKTTSKSSSHIELLAVINMLERINDNKLRIYTDSQYVRKGITEWIYHWRENNFMTANGTKAKNADDWMKLQQLIINKYIEWVWIKGHRDNVIHNHVDQNVRKKAKEC